MKLAKSLLLGSAAGLAAVAGAQAADLPAKKAAPVEYVRVCSTYGAGFFYIPGTESCLRVGGRVRAELRYVEPFNRVSNALRFRARGRLNIDTRTATAYGLLRAYIRYEITQDSASSATSGTFGLVEPGVTSNVAQAFVQFGGLTAGKVTSFFSNPDLPTAHFGTLRFDDAPDVATFAYTYSFGNGFSATVAVEDGTARRAGNVAGVAGVVVNNLTSIVYGGQTVPDIVGNIRYAGTWGSAQLSGAVHQVRDVSTITDAEYGWAIGFQGSLNLPFLGASDAAWLSAAYTQGALSYIGFNSLQAGSGISAGLVSVNTPDALVNTITGDLKLTTGWSVAGGFTHYWAPTVRTSIFGSYARIELPGQASVILPSGAAVGFPDVSEWRIGGNTIWSPVAGLNLGLEVLYVNASSNDRIVVAPTALGFLKSSDSAIEGRIRVQRDF